MGSPLAAAGLVTIGYVRLLYSAPLSVWLRDASRCRNCGVLKQWRKQRRPRLDYMHHFIENLPRVSSACVTWQRIKAVDKSWSWRQSLLHGLEYQICAFDLRARREMTLSMELTHELSSLFWRYRSQFPLYLSISSTSDMRIAVRVLFQSVYCFLSCHLGLSAGAPTLPITLRFQMYSEEQKSWPPLDH